jgi:hypothetical protein
MTFEQALGVIRERAPSRLKSGRLALQCTVKAAGLQRVQLPPGNWFAPPIAIEVSFFPVTKSTFF